ncbi:MAG: uroporphyrin-III C-methyltransferase/precorrin-2 dehydrogenase/sirohydrochlorin ferrochelatase [Lysobacterales bacterium]|jgi:uroporphyrin-III C-methyltransferase/precorrin-2 dehydrogenase/sirohydrochlorin ferrochelatase
MQYFPIFMDVRDQTVLVAGGGNVAERKIRLLLRAGARPIIAARELNQAVDAWHKDGDIIWAATEYDLSLLDNARLVFAATNDGQLNRQIFTDAEARGIPVNVVDDIQHCRFITPAIIDRSPIQIAISSSGTSPVLARRIRSWIERLLPQGIGKVARAAGNLREQLRTSMNLHQRRQFWDQRLSMEKVSALNQMSVQAIEKQFKKEITHTGPTKGKAYLVSAGPGRADLLTLRALQLLGQADVILHDRLVPREILDMARRDAEFIDTGKRAGCHHKSQDQINRLLAEQVQSGKQVVRLKGGDAFIFGRGGEELEHLRSLGLEYEVVPGITAAIGCAAYAGIPLTHRDHSSAITFVTGHGSANGKQPEWNQLAGSGRTVAIYMGLKQASVLKRKLLSAGISPDLPVALISDGTRDSQHVLHGSITELPELAARAPTGAPGLLIIGEVAALGKNLNWFEGLPRARKAA